MNPLHSLETALERVGRILSRQYNITVRCKGSDCKTDGRTIWLPALPSELPPETWTLIRGELDHETAHILFSDFSGRMKTFRQKWGDFGFDLLNIIEDVRVNFAMQKEYPGSSENIQQSIETITQEHNIGKMPLPVRFLCGLFLAGMNLPYDRYGVDAQAFVRQFRTEAQQFKTLCMTNQACDMAEAILKRMKSINPQALNPISKPQNQSSHTQSTSSPPHAFDKKEKETPKTISKNPSSSEPEEESGKEQHNSPPSSPSSRSEESTDDSDNKNSSDGGSSDSENEDKIEERDGEDKSERGETSKNDVEDSKKEADNPSKNQTTSSSDQPEKNTRVSTQASPPQEQNLSPSFDPSQWNISNGQYQSSGNPFELSRCVQQHIAEAVGEGTDSTYRIYDPASDKLTTPKALDRGEAYQALFKQVRPHIAVLRQQLLRTLRARDARFWNCDREEGTINSRRLYALLNHGSPKVFRQNMDCDADSVAVLLLIDLSGSMIGYRINLARQAALLFAETLQQLRIASEIIGFTTHKNHRILTKIQADTGLDMNGLSHRYSRFFPCAYTLFKGFEEPFKSLKGRIPAMEVGEYTPLNDAVLFAAKRIVQRQETRKVILVLTDGEPFSGNSIQQQIVIKDLIRNLQLIERAGIECVAVGIQAEYIKRYFKDYINVMNLAELPKAFYAKFAQLLRRNGK